MSSTTEKTVVFVCDDEPMDLSVVRRILETDGRFEVLTCSDYTSGVSLFEGRQNEVDLALLDVALPGKNGVELARHILEANPRVKVLFVSGHVGASVLEVYGIRATDSLFLQKPFTSATLIKRIEEAMASAHRLEFVQSAASSQSSDL